MENATTDVSQNVSSQSVAIPEKKHDMAWVISQIILREFIVGFPIIMVLMIIAGIIVVSSGVNIEALLQRAQAEPEFAKQLAMLNQLVSAVLFPISYIGTRWGCKYVTKALILRKRILEK
ncbi:MAG: hypothetical protein IPL87_01080 [Candidatus Moraniibacteriota bacterium]|nr:MAG: hypothetical protein IPL87_01080 [Candidatus Moranbacteria bacterium]